jgi:hypothetical protein
MQKPKEIEAGELGLMFTLESSPYYIVNKK